MGVVDEDHLVITEGFNQPGPYFYDICFNGNNHKCRPEQVTALVMAHLKAIAEKSLAERVTEVVVTVPF